MSGEWRYWSDIPSEYFNRAALAAETVTLFVPLSGRTELWPAMAEYLDRQSWPHDQTRLILLESSQDADFSCGVRRWLADCDYADVRHIRESVGERGPADRPRYEAPRDVSLAMARIYHPLARAAPTDYESVAEDDR